MAERGGLLRRQGEMRTGRGADDEIRALDALHAPLIRHGGAALRHDGLAVAVGTERDRDRAAGLHECTRREPPHLAVADHDRAFSCERAEKAFRPAHAGLRRRGRHPGQPCLGAHTLACGDGTAEQRIEHRVRRFQLARECGGILDLRNDLVIPEDLRLHPGRDLHQMTHRLAACALHEERTARRRSGGFAQHLRRVRQHALPLCVQVQLGAAACREQHRRAAGPLCDAQQNRLHLSPHQRQLFALLKCCAHMVNACHTEFHVCSSSVILPGRRGIRLPQTRLLRRFSRISAR